MERPLVDRPPSATGTLLQLWVRKVKLDSLARQQINFINGVHPANMGGEIPVIEYRGVQYTKLVDLFQALDIRQAGAPDNVISSQAARKITVPLDPQRFYSLLFADFHDCFHDFKLNIFTDLTFLREVWQPFQTIMDSLDEVCIPGCECIGTSSLCRCLQSA